MKTKEFLKKHGLVIALAAAAVVAFVLYLRARATSAASSLAPQAPAGTTSPADTAAQMQLAAAQLAAQTQEDVARIQAGRDVALASLGAQTSQAQTAANLAASNASVAAQVARAQAAQSAQQSHDLFNLVGNTVGQIVPLFQPPVNVGSGTDVGTVFEGSPIGSAAPLIEPDFSGQDVLAA